MRSAIRASSIANVMTAASIVLAATVAAAAAHVGIDAIGDYVLPRDAYDDVAHGSRAMTAVLVAVVSLVCVAVSFWAALLDARGGRARVAFERALDRAPLRFIAAVVVGALLVVLGMETLDTLAQNGRIDDFADLLGGSIVLALVVTIPSAVIAACLLRSFLRTIFRSCRALVAAVGCFLRRALHRVATAPYSGERRRIAGLDARRRIMSRHASRRAPPHASFRCLIAA